MERGTGVSVERLTARWTGRAAPGVDERQARRVWLSTLLAGCDLLPPAMPPSATLVVRKLADPLPGRIARSRHAVRPEPEWEQAVRAALGDLWRRAPRPGALFAAASGSGAPPVPVPDDAEAVLFLDAAELAACLVIDLAEGTAGARWWWRELLPPGGGGLFTVLSRQPELLPVVLAYLAASGKARLVAAALSHSEALLLALAMAAAYGLPDWRNGAAALARAAAHGTGAPFAEGAVPTRPWALAVDRLVTDLAPEQAVLLGLGLTLAGAPAATCRLSLPDLEEGLALWWEEAFSHRSAPVTPPSAAVAAALASAKTAAVRRKHSATREAPFRAPAVDLEEPRVQPVASPDRPSAARGEADAATQTEAGSEWPLPAALPPEGAVTRIGGVLYLINVMRQLGLPAAFPGDLSPWALLEALARAMLPGGDGDPFAELAGDPLWAALALLDGREPRTLPGDGVDLPFEMPLPPDWPRLDPADLSETLAAELHPALAAWLALAVPAIDRHLQAALQMKEPIPHLLLVPGRLHVTATHVELTMDIERISVLVRMAGLDQDPGWQAPFRRVILFHFH